MKKLFKRLNTLWIIVSIFTLLANCAATNPATISPQYVSPAKYKNMDCDAIFEEERQIKSEERQLTTLMKGKRRRDITRNWLGWGLGGLILWPLLPLGWFNNGQNPADDLRLADIKGEKKAIGRGIASCTRNKNKATQKRTQEVQPVIINNRND